MPDTPWKGTLNWSPRPLNQAPHPFASVNKDKLDSDTGSPKAAMPTTVLTPNHAAHTP